MVQQQLPCDVPQLAWLLRLMQLGVEARNSLREGRYVTPPRPARDLHGVSAHLFQQQLHVGCSPSYSCCLDLLRSSIRVMLREVCCCAIAQELQQPAGGALSYATTTCQRPARGECDHTVILHETLLL
jgi:hypothetical protein